MFDPILNAATSAPPSPRGKGWIRGLSLALGLALTTPLSAQIIPTGTPAADILLSQALTEHRTFLTCSALDPQTHAQIVANWQRDVTAAAALLAAANVPQDAVTAFTTAAKPENLMPAQYTPFEDVQQLCASQPDWYANYFEFRLIFLELKLPQALP